MFFPDDMNFQYFFFSTYPGFFLQALPIALIAVLIYGIAAHRNSRGIPSSQKVSSCLFVGYMVELVCLLLFLDIIGELWYRIIYHMPTGDHVSIFDFSGDFQLIPDLDKHTNGEIVGNIVMFLPFRFLYPLSKRGAGLGITVASGALFSMIIEILQPAFGRAFDVVDIILNTFAVFIAAAVFFIIRSACRKKRN